MIKFLIKLHNYAQYRYNQLIKDRLFKYNRRQFAKRDFTQKQAKTTPITVAQKSEIISFWKEYYDIENELHWFDFYNTFCENKQELKYYIPDSIYYAEIDSFFTNPDRADQLDDKNLYDLIFFDIKMPATIVRKTNGVLLDNKYHIITENQAIELCKAHNSVISKKAIYSEGGKGIRFFDFQSSTDNDLKEWLAANDELIIQEVIQQHQSLNRIHDKSINTIRIMTLMLDNTVHIVSSVLRMGRDGARVDNASSGGIVCGIDDNGCLKEYACDITGKRWSQHPQGAIFKGFKIEGYEKCRELAKSLAGRISGTSHLVSWDFAIDKEGDPILIEVNLTYGQVDFHQICNGPIFGKLTETVLQQVLSSKK